MINDTLNTVTKLRTALIVAEVFVAAMPKDTPYQNFEQKYALLLFTKLYHTLVGKFPLLESECHLITWII